MDNIKLILPCDKYLEGYLDACKEFKQLDLNFDCCHDSDRYDEWKNTLLENYSDHSRGINLPSGYVPYTTYWLVEGDTFIGRGSIRHYLNKHLKDFGGHIGYFIRPSYWRKGYGTYQLKLLLEKANELGIANALLTCDVSNTASAKVMEKNGGRRIGQFDIKLGEKERKIFKYEIATY